MSAPPTSNANLHTIAQQVREAYTTAPIAPLRDRISSQDEAYRVQEINTQHWLGEGRRIAGRKIGLTASKVQAQLGVDQPDFGVLFADMEMSEADEIPLSAVMQPKIEAEVAFVLGKDIDQERPSLADIVRAIEFALPAFEIVGSRIADWNIRFVDTVADNASSGLYVLGGHPRRLDQLDLYNCKMEMLTAGGVASSGEGRACLGNPLNAARWLAAILLEMGTNLKAGDVVLSGALGPMVTVEAGQTYMARVEGLGEVSARFGKE